MIIDVRIARMVEEDPNIDEEVAIGRLIREVLTPEEKGASVGECGGARELHKQMALALEQLIKMGAYRLIQEFLRGNGREIPIQQIAERLHKMGAFFSVQFYKNKIGGIASVLGIGIKNIGHKVVMAKMSKWSFTTWRKKYDPIGETLRECEFIGEITLGSG